MTVFIDYPYNTKSLSETGQQEQSHLETGAAVFQTQFRDTMRILLAHFGGQLALNAK